jgi:hypothetical protein
MSSTTPYKTFDEKTLPAECAPLMGGAIPLPPGIPFFAVAPASGGSIAGWLIGVAVFVLAGIGLMVGDRWFNQLGNNGSYRETSHTLFGWGIGGVLIAVGCFWKVMLDFKRLRGQQSGTGGRYGLFLTSDHLFIRSDIACYCIPRPEILRFDSQITEETGGTLVRSTLHVRTPEGEADLINIDDCLEKQERIAAHRAIQAWLPPANVPPGAAPLV